MKADELEHAIRSDIISGLKPFLVAGTAGTTHSGSIDPLKEIGIIAKKYGLWYHIDGAYGGFFILADSVKHKLHGIEMSDSLVVDPHKSLFVPFGLGAVLIKRKIPHYKSGSYFQDFAPDDMYNVFPESTRHFRAPRLWIPLKLHGLEPFKACLEEKILLTKYFRIKVKALGFEIGPEPDLSVTYFWYDTHNSSTEKFNRELMTYIMKERSIFVTSATINNNFVIRIAILNFRTKKKTIDKCLEVIAKALIETKRLIVI